MALFSASASQTSSRSVAYRVRGFQSRKPPPWGHIDAGLDSLRGVEFYTGHEGLLMDYERPMTRIDSRTQTPYNTSAQFLWIGDRTHGLDGAHVY